MGVISGLINASESTHCHQICLVDQRIDQTELHTNTKSSHMCRITLLTESGQKYDCP
jgi:hypothetical protein